ncbi:MAG TPA: hemin uptake protein HemP [Stellaceae bacterium]|nr:hemin uptake protein HemP [Stellaceae bacterium]
MTDPSSPDLPPPTDENTAEPRIVSSESLLAGQRELLIQHGAERYRLRLTASNKLILVK